MNICVLGSGYVGLVQAACLAENGNIVTCIDIDPQKLQRLSNGDIPIYEPGLKELVLNNIEARRLYFQGSMPLCEFDFIFVCVGTPENSDGSPNLTYLKAAYKSIVSHIKFVDEDEDYYPIVVNKSTVPVGTAQKMFNYLKDELHKDITVASNPEFLKEGTAVSDCMKPDRIIVGIVPAWTEFGSTLEDVEADFRKLYEPFARSREKLIFMDSTSAELTKYAANAMLMARVCIMNELADVAEKFDANIENIRKGIALDPRVGSQFLYAGPGTGGSCFIKDVQSLIHSCVVNKAPYPSILSQVYESNERRMDLKPYLTIADYYEKMGWSIRGRTFAVLGYTFKANTDDTRHSAAKPLIDKLVAHGAYVQVYDPKAKIPQQENVKYCTTLRDALLDCNAAIIMTEWNEFRNPELFTYKNLGDNILFDFRNIFSLETMAAQDTTYISVGRPVIYGVNTVDNFEEN